ncbi:sperm flagellar protein 2-like [Pectinophora gossypiella]|uniref:sperm flagellar protein 2-like n=1 Tax=Pectinophora gossypiella TaxID=13191 RepID=UPI00214F0D83|nr:sperm flagellar protein 2-like [Pectinophora gossypiella]
MAEILKEWLTERLQRPIKWEATEFGDMMKNGNVVANVLLSYHVINEEKVFLIRPSNAPVDVANNWKYLADWLRDVDVYLTEVELSNIMDGKGSALLRLFYQLFLHLDKRDRTNFLKRERKMVSSLVEKINHRFDVKKVDEDEESAVDDLSRPLLNEQHYIDWQRKKAAQVKDTYDYVRYKYSKMMEKIEESKTPCWQYVPPKVKKLSSKEKTDMETFSQKYPCKFENYTYEELLGMEEESEERRKSFVDTEWAKHYLEDLYCRLRRKEDSEEFQTQLRNVISNSLWDLSVGEEEAIVDLDLAKKSMKLSQFEKQMCTQIMETKQQARNLVKNRIDAEREYADQRDLQFNQYLDNLKEQIHMEVVEIDFEKHRQEMLHKKLYAEKMKRKRQHYYEICYETMLSLVDYATKYAYFRRLLDDDIPEHFIHEWKTLYFRKQPIFDILDPMEDLLKEHALEEEPAPEEEEIIRLELDRQDALNDSEFMEYHNYSYPWTLDLLLPNYDHESEERKYEYLGTRILGHLVYTLLEIKYPYPPPRPPADLPDFPSKGLIRNLPDKAITIPMQTLLNHCRIHVVRLETAINFCLRQFKHEMIGCTDIEISYDKFGAAAPDEEGREFIKVLKADDEMYSKTSDGNISAISGPIPPNCKQTQTPKTLPEEDITLSTPAELGKYAYEALSFGDSLTDHLVCAMLVEYIKDQEDINGFVIINYPNSYREAQILEETFSGREPPTEGDLDDRDDIYLEESIVKHRKKEKDPFKEIRVSRIVNNPHKRKIEEPFQSYFTCYLKLKETEDILQEYIIWDLTSENSELIDRFYAALGMNYSMYYEVIEKDLLAQICKYIIGDYSLPLKSNERLFGGNVLSLLDFPLSDDRRTKSKTIKPEASTIKSKDKLRRSSKGSRSNTNPEFEVVKAPDSTDEVRDDTIAILEEVAEEEVEMKSVTTTEEIKILAGEEEWDYGVLPISEIIGIALATCWEQIEKTYIHDLEQLFFAKRLQMNCVIPYTRFLKDKMEQIIRLPSHKQDLVSRFQKEYNNFEDDWRDVHLTKNEWHCRIIELKNKLYNICDERKIFSEQQRQSLIMENWTAEELITMANTYISCMQTELNRSVLTFQALHDFYFAMIKKMPPHDRLTSKDLIKVCKELEESGGGGGKKPVEDKIYRQLKAAFQDMQLKNIQIDYSNNPLNMIIENNVKFAQKVIKDINDHYRSVISKEYSELAKMVPAVKKKDENASQESINLEELFKSNGLKCIDEWIMGINGEMYRANLRLQALQHKCYQDMRLFNNMIYNAFTDIQNSINAYYMNEIKSVDRLCKYLQLAVENGKKIPELLVLDQDTFIIDPNLLLFTKPQPAPETGDLTEMVDSIEFKIGQLARLRTQFKIVAPNGIALQQAFVYLIQDFIFFGKESCEGSLFPELWKRIDPEQVTKLVYLLFGETAYVDWRDFLVYCLNVRYPTIEELLETRKKFRCSDPNSTELVDRDVFINEELWFEVDFDTEDRYSLLRKNLIKHFLFELFECAENKMNYSAFLLAFCKSVDPIEGFAAALSMAVGKKTCYVYEECEEVVCKLIEQKQYRDACLACAHKCTNEFLDQLIANVIDFCAGTSITEIQFTEVEEKKGGKGKKAGKGKEGKDGKEGKGGKVESSQSARTPKAKEKSVQDSRTQAQSDTNMKISTYICGPCAEEAMPEEKPVELDKVVEEESALFIDPDLAYTVTQETIWNVLRICLPWHFVLFPEEKKTPYVGQVEEVMKKLAVNTDSGDIYVSMFVADPVICKLLNRVNKFTALNLVHEVRKVCM